MTRAWQTQPCPSTAPDLSLAPLRGSLHPGYKSSRLPTSFVKLQMTRAPTLQAAHLAEEVKLLYHSLIRVRSAALLSCKWHQFLHVRCDPVALLLS